MAAIRVSLVSGELIAVYQGEGQTARTLKLFLASKVKHSRFCQRLLCEDGSELSDDAKLLPFMNLQLVLLQFWCDSEQAQEQLIQACKVDDIDRVEMLLCKPLDPNMIDEKCAWTALHFAAWYGSSKCVALLLTAGAETDQVANLVGEGVVPLHLAAERGHSEIVGLLLEAKANNDPRTYHGFTPLTLAARFGHVQVVSLLVGVSKNLDAITTDLGTTALHLSVQGGHLEVVQLLLDARACKDKVSRARGLTPLHLAAMCGHFKVTQLLVEAGANLKKPALDTGELPLHFAIQQGHIGVVELLSSQKHHLSHRSTMLEKRL